MRSSSATRAKSARSLYAVSLGLLLASCSGPRDRIVKSVESGIPVDQRGLALLKQSMDAYGRLPSFRAECQFSMQSDREGTQTQVRTISFERPNRYRVESRGAGGLKLSAVSDGTSELEFDNMGIQPPRTSRSPFSIADATSMVMRHPMFCGTLLYQFFAGAQNIDAVLDQTKGALTFKDSAGLVNHEPTAIVSFFAQGEWGNVKIQIGKKTGLIYRLEYDSSTFQSPNRVGQGLPNKVSSVETYSKVDLHPKFSADQFHPTPPLGTIPVDSTAQTSGGSKSPVGIGTSAPDFTVATFDGIPVSLASMRGHPVLIDYWATWCPPCLAGLPKTNEIAKKFASQGLKVMTICDEDLTKVKALISEKGYTFPTYVDFKHQVGHTYQIDVIPVVIVINAEGNLVDYIVGGDQEPRIRRALRNAGIKLD